MLSYIARRKRWWSTLRELDPDIRLSEAMWANLLVELSGLDRTEQLMVKTAARTHSIDAYAKILVQHHSVVHMKERLLTSKDTSGPGRPGSALIGHKSATPNSCIWATATTLSIRTLNTRVARDGRRMATGATVTLPPRLG